MVDVPLRHKPLSQKRLSREPARSPAGGEVRPGRTERPGARWLFLALAAVIVAAGGLVLALMPRQGSLDLIKDRRPVMLTVAGHSLVVPANMLRAPSTRSGGRFDSVDLVLHWPDLEGFGERTAADFTSGDPRAPIIYATIGAQLAPLDATARLDTVYARFFSGKPLAGPAGLVGRALGSGSGFDGEIVYFVPSAPQPFVARCPATETPEVPATCLRDINFGKDLTILFRFDRSLLGQWQQLEAGMRRLAANVLVR